MNVSYHCPNCNSKYKSIEELIQNLKCPKCGARVKSNKQSPGFKTENITKASGEILQRSITK